MTLLHILLALLLFHHAQPQESVFALPGPLPALPCSRGYADTEIGWAQQFIFLNTTYFGGRLPKTTRVISSESVDEGNIAETTWNAARLSLVHEMIHIKNGPNEDDPHGPKFKHELRRLVLVGALDDSF